MPYRANYFKPWGPFSVPSVSLKSFAARNMRYCVFRCMQESGCDMAVAIYNGIDYECDLQRLTDTRVSALNVVLQQPIGTYFYIGEFIPILILQNIVITSRAGNQSDLM